MRIGIDARLYGLEHAGIGRYVMHLVQELQSLDTTHEYILFLRQDDYDNLKLPSRWTKVLADIRHYTLKEQLALPQLIRSARVDLMHFPHFNVPLFYHQPFVVTIHDLLWHEFKGFNVTTLNPLIYFLKYGSYRLVVHHALFRARHILVPSFWVSQKLQDQFGLPAGKISVTYEGIAAAFLDRTGSGVKLDPPVIVYTGSAYPHKNLRLLFEAIKLLNQRGTPVNLTVISSRSVFLEELRAYVHRERLDQYINFVGFLSDQDLRRLYSQATALVHPSLSEGFGLTGLEAMASKLPVLSSSAGSLPEIYQDAALYFDPHDPADLAAKLTQVLTDPRLIAALRAKGRRLAHTYTWSATAKKTLEVYESQNH